MPLLAKEESTKTDFPPGVHNALCIGVVDLGIHPNEYQGQKRPDAHRIALMFEFPGLLKEWEGVESPMRRTHTFNNSLKEKAGLRKFLTSWYGRQLTAKECSEGIALEKLVGAAFTLQYIDDDGKVRLGTAMSCNAELPEPTERIVYRIEDHPAQFDKLADWMRDEVLQAINAPSGSVNPNETDTTTDAIPN